MILRRHMHCGSYIIAFRISNTLLLQASLHLIPQIETPIFFCISKDPSLNLVLSPPWPPTEESKDTASADGSSLSLSSLWTASPFLLPK